MALATLSTSADVVQAGDRKNRVAVEDIANGQAGSPEVLLSVARKQRAARKGLDAKRTHVALLQRGEQAVFGGRLGHRSEGEEDDLECGNCSIIILNHRRSCEEMPTNRALPCFFALSRASITSQQVSNV